MLPDRGIAYNRSGQFEVVQTLEQIKAIAALLESSQGTIVIENLIVEANKIDEVQKMLDMLNGVAANARKGGFGDYETEL
jgi:translation elongation factor EF-1alpha